MTDVVGILNVGTGGYRVISASYPDPDDEVRSIEPSDGDLEVVIGSGPGKLREVNYHLVIEAASVAAVNSLWRDLISAGPDARSGRAVDLVTGSATDPYPVTFKLRAVKSITSGSGGAREPVYEVGANGGYAAHVYVTWLADRYAYGPEQTMLGAAALSAPVLIDLEAYGMLGDAPAPLEVTLQSDGVNKFHSVHMGLLPADCGWTDFISEAEAIVWSGGAPLNVYDAASHARGDYYTRNTSTTWAGGVKDTSKCPPGSYLPLARVEMANGADTGHIGTYSPADGLTTAGQPFTGVTWAVEELPELRLPRSKVRGAASDLTIFVMKSSSGAASHDVRADWFGLCPRSWGFVSWHHRTPGSVTDRLRVGYDGTVYLSDAADFSDVSSSGPLIADPHGKLVVFAEDGAGAVGSEPIVMTLKARPRHLQWRSGGELPASPGDGAYLSARDHGMAPANSAAANAAAFQDLLDDAEGGTAYVEDGDYSVSTVSVIHSNTHLKLSAGARITLTGSTGRLLQNEAVGSPGRDSDIRISGSLDGTFGRDSTACDAQLLRFRRVDGLTLEDFTCITGVGKDAISPGSITNFIIRGIRGYVNSALVQVQGPASSGLIERISGRTLDDTVALCGGDYAAYRDGEGDIEDVVVRNVMADNDGVGALVHVLAGLGNQVRRIAIEGVRGNCNQGSLVSLRDDALDAHTIGSDVDDVTVRNVVGTTERSFTGYAGVWLEGPGYGDVKVDGVSVDGNAVLMGARTTLQSLELSNAQLAADSHYQAFAVTDGASIGRLTLSKSSLALDHTRAAGAIVAIGNAQVDEVLLEDVAQTGGGQAIYHASATPTAFTLRRMGLTDTTFAIFCNGSCTCSARLDEVTFDYVSGAIAALITAASGLKLIVGHVAIDSGLLTYKANPAAPLRVNGALGKLDLSTINAAVAGDVAYNTNAGLGCGVGICRYNGSHWINLATGASY